MKNNFKRMITAMAAAVMCAVPMTGAMSASASETISRSTGIKMERMDTSSLASAVSMSEVRLSEAVQSELSLSEGVRRGSSVAQLRGWYEIQIVPVYEPIIDPCTGRIVGWRLVGYRIVKKWHSPCERPLGFQQLGFELDGRNPGYIDPVKYKEYHFTEELAKEIVTKDFVDVKYFR